MAEIKAASSFIFWIAQGSARELETHQIIAGRAGLPTPQPDNDPAEECKRVCKMLRSLIRALESRQGDVK